MMRPILKVLICISFIVFGIWQITDIIRDPKELGRTARSRRMLNMLGEPLYKAWNIFLGVLGIAAGVCGIITVLV